jgi:hypothetical protein
VLTHSQHKHDTHTTIIVSSSDSEDEDLGKRKARTATGNTVAISSDSEEEKGILVAITSHTCAHIITTPGPEKPAAPGRMTNARGIKPVNCTHARTHFSHEYAKQHYHQKLNMPDDEAADSQDAEEEGEGE